MPTAVGTMHDMDASGRTAERHIEVYAAAPTASTAALWRLLATPELWPVWAPHIRRAATEHAARRPADADGSTVRAGDRVRIDGWAGIHVDALITEVVAGRRWDFWVDLPLGHQLTAAHEVLTDPPAVRVRLVLHGPLGGQVGRALLRAYRPLAQTAVSQLVDEAQRPVAP